MPTRLPFLLPCSMTHVAPSLPNPSDLLSAWSWRDTAQKKLPMSSPAYQQHSIVLPPIKNLDFDTPSPSPDYIQPPQAPAPLASPSNCNPSTQWYGPRTSVSTVSEKTAEMMCYLWFSSKRDPIRTKRTRTSPSFTKIDPATATMQFSPSPDFIAYVRKLLETTQVSQSVIVLSLHYVFRLRKQNYNTPAQPRSEFRVAVVALMLANKFLDDNTYTNKTWSEVAGINLEELNRMEREFLMGIDSQLYVDKMTYESWLQLLKGLVLAKEREYQHWQHLRRAAAVNRLTSQRTQFLHSEVPAPIVPHRPRSTSPRSRNMTKSSAFTFSIPMQFASHTQLHSYHYGMDAEDEPIHSGRKRAGMVNYELSRPTKRVATLQVEHLPISGGPRSAGPAFSSTAPLPPTTAFSNLSIANRDASASHSLHPPRVTEVSQPHQSTASSLVQPYPPHQIPLNSQPQHLYFYTLAGSPLDASDRPQGDRKAQLRYAPAEVSSAAYTRHLPRPRPLIVHSANVSPRDLSLRMGSRAAPWQDEPERHEQHQHPIPPLISNHSLPYHSTVPAAHFANAGPPGVHWSVSTPENLGWPR